MSNIWKEFHGPNAAYVLELYEQYQQNPQSVDARTQAYFAQITPALINGATPPPSATHPKPTEILTEDSTTKIFTVVNYATAIRDYGHLAAKLDPLGTPRLGDPSLQLSNYGLEVAELRDLPANLIGGPLVKQTSNAAEAVEALRQVYMSTIGYDFEHVHNPAERKWLRQAAESGHFMAAQDPIDESALLNELTDVEGFELFLHRTFVGKTRFSIEGLDMMVPMLNQIISDTVNKSTIRDILIGMAHRGRLNVLTHVLGKQYVKILAEFKDPIDYDSGLPSALTGDVKYHNGAVRTVVRNENVELVVAIAPNPSHLEHVNPVVMGMSRAAGTRTDQPGAAIFEPLISLPILIHGDAAFPGQGVVAETLNMHRLPGYTVGGTMHLIANNQIGFTTDDNISRSTTYASDLAKGFEIPIVHVNADDPEACIAVSRLALAYMLKFQKDIVIDLIGYRRYGHNEGDEPRFTQPLMYDKIDQHPTVRQILANRLIQKGIITAGEAKAKLQAVIDNLQKIYESFEPKTELPKPSLDSPEPGTARKVITHLPADKLKAWHDSLWKFPEGFTVNAKLKRVLDRRQSALETYNEATIDWGTAEALALASILAAGIPIRLTGEDVGRGTFSHRHAVLHDQVTGVTFTPLQKFPHATASFEIHNSPLSENAAVGFEYGYNIQAGNELVIWEGQYGDFIDGAQAMLDEFVISGFAKWAQTPSLVLLLPHGYEGQGPDHSTGRLERFLQSAAEINMRIANCTTAAQYFHLLRRQALLLKKDPLPLIIMTPKSLLRQPLAASPLSDLVEHNWQPFLDDVEARQHPQKIKQVLLCSGKIYFDLVTSEYHAQHPEIAIIRIEQLYPLMGDVLGEMLDEYPNLKKVTWVQEEPKNMGAWESFKPQLIRVGQIIGAKWTVDYIGRPRRSSPAEGSTAWHAVNQKELIARAFNNGQ